jgi:glycerophosphoryl diester phosphodiesterase
MSRSPILLGHRGALRYAPENTLPAFDLALEHGCDGFEFDVRLTHDGVAAVCHDPAINGLSVADSDFAALLTATGGTLPRMQEVWERYRDRAFINIELKVPGLEGQVAELLRRSAMPQGAFVSSFLPEVVRALDEEEIAAPLGYVCKDPAKLAWWKELGVEYVVLHFSLITPELAAELDAAGKRLVVWTINDEREMRRMAGIGVYGIISDDTQHLRRVLRPEADGAFSAGG